MSQEYHLLTRDRPRAEGLADALGDATRGDLPPAIDGDFGDPDGYLNISGTEVWIEIEPPGHVEVADLVSSYGDGRILPEPDEEQCLWLTVATVPAGVPERSSDVAWRVFEDLARRYQGRAIDPAQ